MNMNDGGPAFPVHSENGMNTSTPTGMTLRDYFAAKAMQGWIASFPKDAEFKKGREPVIADFAFRVADAMLA